MVLCDAVTVCDRDCRVLELGRNQLSGTIPKSFLFLDQDLVIYLSPNLLTGDATLFVEKFGAGRFEYNCFNPAVPPSNPYC
jgi:hypothetical protein